MAMAATVALSAEPDYLGADELTALIVGKTIEVADTSRVLFRVYFDADGQRYGLQQDGEYALPWRVLPDGTQCVTTSTGDDCARVARNGDGTYTRYRDGSAVNLWLQIIPGKVLAAPPSAPGVYARKTGPDQYVVLVNGPTVTERTGAPAGDQSCAAGVQARSCLCWASSASNPPKRWVRARPPTVRASSITRRRFPAWTAPKSCPPNAGPH